VLIEDRSILVQPVATEDVAERIATLPGRELRAGAFTTPAKPAGIRTWRDYLAATS
jgi:hypothetical protein